MNRTTIDYGIDLGTTNSSIALLKGVDAEVIRNNDGSESTPSVVWINKRGELYVGQRAKNRLVDDPGSSAAEFKLQMGTDYRKVFECNDRGMTAEQLSAEILKELKAAVMQRKGESLQAAVISVPAAFEAPQCQATKEAAELAGFSLSPLIQEPVAAAMAYGFQDQSDKVFWLIYDFGGGTFDAAIIQVRDGVIQVVNHGGDNHLGGKLVDWAIVDELLVPAITKEHPIGDFTRSNPRWREAFAKLKDQAEEAKIRLSRYETETIFIDRLCDDDRGKPIELEYELKKEEVEKLIEPLALRSINICKKVMQEKKLGASDIAKLILVGGPTLTPYLRNRLADNREGLGIPLEFSIDPLTVVARGAAIFAGTQRLKMTLNTSLSADVYAIELEYKPIGPDAEPLLGGRVISPDGNSVSSFTIEFTNTESRPPWKSGKIGLDENGAFITELWADKGRRNTYLIDLLDPAGTKVKTEPENLIYTIGQVITNQPLIHSMGVALASNEALFFFEKGQPLPAKKRMSLSTAFDVRQGQEGELIRIPVIEGENRRADRNSFVGEIVIAAHEVRRNVPAGSEVEVSIEIDESRLIKTKAYVPLLDEEYEEVIDLGKSEPNIDLLQQRFRHEKDRLADVRAKALDTRDAKAEEGLQKIAEEKIAEDIEKSLAASGKDRDALDKAQNRLRDLQVAIDEVEDAIEWPAMLANARAQLSATEEFVSKFGDSQDQREIEMLRQEMHQAMETHDAELLKRKIDDLMNLGLRSLAKKEGVIEYMILTNLEERRGEMRDRSAADALFGQAHRAVRDNDIGRLHIAIRQLLALLPIEQQADIRRGFGSTVLKAGS